jgi:hypothetical protein
MKLGVNSGSLNRKRSEVRKMEFEIEELESLSPKHPNPCSLKVLAMPY